MLDTTAQRAGLLVAVALVLLVLSNTVFDGETLGGIAFLGWVLALVAAIVVAARGRRHHRASR